MLLYAGVHVPIFTITLTEPGVFIMAVHQQDERCAGAKKYVDVGVTVLQRDEATGNSQAHC